MKSQKISKIRRQFPLRILFPTWALEDVQTIHDKILSVHPKDADYSRISLLESKLDRDPEIAGTHWKLSSTLTIFVRRITRTNETNYILRHCFCSWTVLRMVASYQPALAQKLKVQSHELWSEQALNDFRAVLERQTPGAPYSVNCLTWRLSKLMGHRNTGTALNTYRHLEYILDEHLKSPLFEAAKQIEVSTNCKAFLTARSSPATLSKIGRKIGDIADYVYQTDVKKRARRATGGRTPKRT